LRAPIDAATAGIDHPAQQGIANAQGARATDERHGAATTNSFKTAVRHDQGELVAKAHDLGFNQFARLFGNSNERTHGGWKIRNRGG
jgi:hypothetical protein